MNPRFRSLTIAALALLAVWLLAWGSFRLAGQSRMTAEKYVAYLRNTDLASLRGAERQRALRELARKLNALELDERRKARADREWERWFSVMTDEEKVAFIEATMPTGFKQMLVSFEKLPEQKRKKAIDDAMKRLKAVRDGELPPEESADRPPVMSEELQQKVLKVGLQTYYSQSSAQTKAEMAPLLEEMQRMMESGMLFRR